MHFATWNSSPLLSSLLFSTPYVSTLLQSSPIHPTLHHTTLSLYSTPLLPTLQHCILLHSTTLFYRLLLHSYFIPLPGGPKSSTPLTASAATPSLYNRGYLRGYVTHCLSVSFTCHAVYVCFISWVCTSNSNKLLFGQFITCTYAYNRVNIYIYLRIKVVYPH